MKVGVSLVLFVVLTVSTTFAQEITFTTTKTNVVASKATIDMPALANNLNAIIVATPLGDTERLNPHPLGAWYYNDKWNIFNTDHANMPSGLKFKVEVFPKPDANHFKHVITKLNIGDMGSYIDNPTLNNNPKATFKFFQNHAPDYRASPLNKFPAKAEYDASAGKWYIANVGGEALLPNTAYNIVISPGAESGTYTSTSPTATVVTTISPTIVTTPTPSNVPVGTVIAPVATLAPPESFPLTVIVRAEFTLPYIGLAVPMGYCRSPVGIYTNPNILMTDTVIVTGQHADGFEELRWSATVSNGSVKITVCHNNQPGYLKQLNISYRKVNILVLR